LRPIAITIDHQLQKDSHLQAEKVKKQLGEMGYVHIFIEKVLVVSQSGLEADARNVRYEALNKKAQEEKASKVFLGHTSNDQAETVLLGLARGSGTRSLSGMAEVNGIYTRPLLAISREITERACKESNLDFWNDPHNEDKNFSRVKIRHEVIPYLQENLDPGISGALIRTASLLREDGEALDLWAAREAQAKLKRDVNDAEADLAKLEVVLSAIDRAMFDPASASNEYKNLTMGELSQRRGKIVAAQEAAEARWVTASEALEKA
jgi:tRNA(Ile)-lysidine synthase